MTDTCTPDTTIWEYSVVALDAYKPFEHPEQLAREGRVGWELVAIENGLAYLKRPSRTQEPANAR